MTQDNALPLHILISSLEADILSKVTDGEWSQVDELVKQREGLLRGYAPLSQAVIESAQGFNQQLTDLIAAERLALAKTLKQSQQKQKVSNAYLTVDGRKR
jgi:hypothetical protein